MPWVQLYSCLKGFDGRMAVGQYGYEFDSAMNAEFLKCFAHPIFNDLLGRAHVDCDVAVLRHAAHNQRHRFELPWREVGALNRKGASTCWAFFSRHKLREKYLREAEVG